MIGLWSCKKNLSTVYRAREDVTISKKGDTCLLQALTVTNLNEAEESYSLSYMKLVWGQAQKLNVQNKVTNAGRTPEQLTVNDSVSLFDGDSIFIDKSTRLVKRIVTKKNPLRFKNDVNDYRFSYKDSLLIQKTCFVNHDTVPYFISKYKYEDTTGRLTVVQLFFAPENRLLFESKISYDASYRVIPWIYLYTDFFSLADHLLVLNFGKRTMALPTVMESVFYDEKGTGTLGTWKTVFSAYKISKDGYVLNLNCSGLKLESLPYLYQNVQCSYQCQ